MKGDGDMNTRNKERLYLCCLQCDAVAMTASGKAARTLSRFASNMFDVRVPLISSVLASIPIGSASRNSERESILHILSDSSYPHQCISQVSSGIFVSRKSTTPPKERFPGKMVFAMGNSGMMLTSM